MLDSLPRPAQLNCYMDGLAKTTIWSQDPEDLPRQDSFPLEPVAIYVDGQKISPGDEADLRFWVQLSELFS